MTTATLGDLLLAATDHLAAARRHSYHQRDAGHLADAITEAARVAGALERYLTDVLIDSGVHLYLSADNATIFAAIHAREALRTAAGHLTTTGNAFSHIRPAPDPDLLTPDISTAAGHLTAGRDLLRTHFTTDADGFRRAASRWSAIITSPPVTSALLQEISKQTMQLWRLTVGLSHTVTDTNALYGMAPNELDRAKHWLRRAQELLVQATARGQVNFPGRALLRAVPVNQVPSPKPLTAPEPLTDLCQGIALSAERLHAIACMPSGQGALLPTHTAESWRWTATVHAVIADLSEALLRSLAERVQALPAEPFARRLLTAAAEAAANTCERWLHVTAAWGEMTTGTTVLPAPGITDSSDLLIRLGRLTFDNQHWTPARERRATLRDPADLAPGPAELVSVFSAVHQAADALASLAVAEEQNVGAMAAARRIYQRVRLRSGKTYTPRPYGRAPLKDLAVLRKTYTSAVAASKELAVALDAASLVLNAPSQLIAAARIATKPGQDTVNTGQPPQLNPTWPALPAPRYRPRGPVEKRLQQLNIDNDLLLVRAQAIDTAARHLITEASEYKARREIALREKFASTSQAQAAQNFPASPTQPNASRPATSASRKPGAAPARRPGQLRS